MFASHPAAAGDPSRFDKPLERLHAALAPSLRVLWLAPYRRLDTALTALARESAAPTADTAGLLAGLTAVGAAIRDDRHAASLTAALVRLRDGSGTVGQAGDPEQRAAWDVWQSLMDAVAGDEAAVTARVGTALLRSPGSGAEFRTAVVSAANVLRNQWIKLATPDLCRRLQGAAEKLAIPRTAIAAKLLTEDDDERAAYRAALLAWRADGESWAAEVEGHQVEELAEVEGHHQAERLTPEPTLLPNQFDFGGGRILSGFTQTDIIILGAIAARGVVGIDIDELRDAVRVAKGKKKPDMAKATQAQIRRLRDSLSKAVRKAHGLCVTIDCTNCRYVLTVLTDSHP